MMTNLNELRAQGTRAINLWLADPHDERTALEVIAPIYEEEIARLSAE